LRAKIPRENNCSFRAKACASSSALSDWSDKQLPLSGRPENTSQMRQFALFEWQKVSSKNVPEGLPVTFADIRHDGRDGSGLSNITGVASIQLPNLAGC
jgi:hypothetical protein